MNATPTLASLLAPLTVENFFQTYWEQTPLYLPCVEAARFADVLTPAQLDQYWQSHNLHPSFLKVIRQGVLCPLEQWTTVEKRQQTEAYRVIAPEKLFALFHAGTSIVFSAAESALPNLMSFCQQLSVELRARVQANLYLTPPHAQAVGPHFDTHNLFVLQISGSKHWRLYDCPVIAPVQGENLGDRYAEQAPARELTLQPGDLLYLPRGLVHVANTAETASLHVALGLHGGFGFHLLEELTALAQTDPFFRQPLPTGAQDSTAWQAEFSQRLQTLVAECDVTELLQLRQAALVDTQPIARPGRVQDLLQAGQLTLETRVARRAGVPYELICEQTRLHVRCGEHELTLPLFMATAVQTLLNGEAHAVQSLRGTLNEQGKLEIVHELIRVGLLTIVE